MKPVRIAMLGSGFVADFYMQGLADVPHQEVVVNYSRSAARADAFARKWTVPESSTNMEALIARDDLDLYI
ncbi:MAG TPA: Gfo/Idh/MocA family oxidoreductase, partial [Acidobacteriaceae bacterium]|nr:Gfo/Idh/MocA family oxidoreductase [Acidobacteriaceae bacterium]